MNLCRALIRIEGAEAKVGYFTILGIVEDAEVDPANASRLFFALLSVAMLQLPLKLLYLGVAGMLLRACEKAPKSETPVSLAG
jgi:hypothetical protein